MISSCDWKDRHQSVLQGLEWINDNKMVSVGYDKFVKIWSL